MRGDSSGAGPLNILGGIPTVATDYSPLWDLNVGQWTDYAVKNNYRTQIRDEFTVRMRPSSTLKFRTSSSGNQNALKYSNLLQRVNEKERHGEIRVSTSEELHRLPMKSIGFIQRQAFAIASRELSIIMKSREAVRFLRYREGLSALPFEGARPAVGPVRSRLTLMHLLGAAVFGHGAAGLHHRAWRSPVRIERLHRQLPHCLPFLVDWTLRTSDQSTGHFKLRQSNASA